MDSRSKHTGTPSFAFAGGRVWWNATATYSWSTINYSDYWVAEPDEMQSLFDLADEKRDE